MVGFRISRKGEFDAPEWRKVRHYRQEAEELIPLLNAVQSRRSPVPPDGQSQFWPHEGRQALSLSMDRAVDWLMKSVRDDIRARNKEGFLAGVLGELSNTRLTPELHHSVAEFVQTGPTGPRSSWYRVVLSLELGRLDERRGGHAHGSAPSAAALTDKRLLHVRKVLQSEPRIFEEVIKLWHDSKHGRAQRLEADGCRVEVGEGKGDLTAEEGSFRRTALKLFELYSVEIDEFFACLVRVPDLAPVLAVRLFESWINEKLEMGKLPFRIALERLDSAFRLVPVEVYAWLNRLGSRELRLVTPATTLAASFVAYITKLGITERLKDWIGGVQLVNLLAFPGVLSLIHPCPASRRKASRDYRRRENEKNRKAAQDVRRDKQNC